MYSSKYFWSTINFKRESIQKLENALEWWTGKNLLRILAFCTQFGSAMVDQNKEYNHQTHKLTRHMVFQEVSGNHTKYSHQAAQETFKNVLSELVNSSRPRPKIEWIVLYTNLLKLCIQTELWRWLQMKSSVITSIDRSSQQCIRKICYTPLIILANYASGHNMHWAVHKTLVVCTSNVRKEPSLDLSVWVF